MMLNYMAKHKTTLKSRESIQSTLILTVRSEISVGTGLINERFTIWHKAAVETVALKEELRE